MLGLTRQQACAALCGFCVLLLLVAGTALRRCLPSSGPAPAPAAVEESGLALIPALPPPDPAPSPFSAVAVAPLGPPAVTPVPARPPVTVHVVGCVRQPGVYSFAEGARVVDAVKRAGGAKPNADLEAINLASRLEDGAQVYVPRRVAAAPEAGKAVPPAVAPPGRIPVASPAAIAPAPPPDAAPSTGTPAKIRSPAEGRVNINRADAAELQRLPGIGPVTAQRVLEYRAANGPFRSVEELLEVRGIGEKRLADMRDLVEL